MHWAALKQSGKPTDNFACLSRRLEVQSEWTQHSYLLSLQHTTIYVRKLTLNKEEERKEKKRQTVRKRATETKTKSRTGQDMQSLTMLFGNKSMQRTPFPVRLQFRCCLLTLVQSEA